MLDVRFKRLKGVLDYQLAKQCQNGENISRKKAEIITPDMEKDLWEKNLLGESSPDILLNTLQFYTGLNFALRGGMEHSLLKMKNFTENEDGSLTYTEFHSKNNQAGLKSINKEPKVVTCFPNNKNPERCLPSIFKRYKSHRPDLGLDPEGKFYLRPLLKPKAVLWFSKQCVGIHKLEKTIKVMMQKANIKGYFTAHSLRATAATRLSEEGTDEQKICEITGHRSNAVRAYKRTNLQQQKNMSQIIQGCSVTEDTCEPNIKRIKSGDGNIVNVFSGNFNNCTFS